MEKQNAKCNLFHYVLMLQILFEWPVAAGYYVHSGFSGFPVILVLSVVLVVSVASKKKEL
jgi:hypothetical protein